MNVTRRKTTVLPKRVCTHKTHHKYTRQYAPDLTLVNMMYIVDIYLTLCADNMAGNFLLCVNICNKYLQPSRCSHRRPCTGIDTLPPPVFESVRYWWYLSVELLQTNQNAKEEHTYNYFDTFTWLSVSIYSCSVLSVYYGCWQCCVVVRWIPGRACLMFNSFLRFWTECDCVLAENSRTLHTCVRLWTRISVIHSLLLIGKCAQGILYLNAYTKCDYAKQIYSKYVCTYLSKVQRDSLLFRKRTGRPLGHCDLQWDACNLNVPAPPKAQCTYWACVGCWLLRVFALDRNQYACICAYKCMLCWCIVHVVEHNLDAPIDATRARMPKDYNAEHSFICIQHTTQLCIYMFCMAHATADMLRL